jgi:hypothetical protein
VFLHLRRGSVRIYSMTGFKWEISNSDFKNPSTEHGRNE